MKTMHADPIDGCPEVRTRSRRQALPNLWALPRMAGWCLPATAEHAGAQANNPLASSTALDFQNQYADELSGIGGCANAFMVRNATPFHAASRRLRAEGLPRRGRRE